MMEIYDDDTNTMDLDFYKLATKAQNAGYREGVSSIKESLYQKGFDIGYEDGFQIGFSLGLIHADKKSLNNLQQSELNELKNNAMKGNCQMCHNENLLSADSINDVKGQQKVANENNIRQLNEKYKNVQMDTCEDLAGKVAS